MIATLAVVCSILGGGAFTAPDNACTPGAYRHLTRAQVCTHRSRPYLPTATRRTILSRYGVPGWTGRNGELDHRVPFFLGGRTGLRNLWPEPGAIPNRKDALETYVFNRVCHSSPRALRVSTARKWFLSDWQRAYERYLG